MNAMNASDKVYLLIDSRERDVNIYPNPNQYVIHLENSIKNVESIVLLHAIYPKKHGTELYVTLHVDELHPKAVSNNDGLKKSFAQLPMINFLNEYKHDLSTPNHLTGRIFEQPLAKLNKLSISFLDFNGELSVMGEHFLKFEVEYSSSQGIQERLPSSGTTTTENESLFHINNRISQTDSYDYNPHTHNNTTDTNLFYACQTLAELGIAYSKTITHHFSEDDLKIINNEYDAMQKILLSRT